jgi:AMP nucleosidase
MALSLNRLSHYTGTPAESFERHVLFTNYAMHVEAFRERFPDSEGPDRDGVQMPAWHHRRPDGDGVSLVNIGVGPANAKTITDHVAVLRPDTMVMIGHCGGLRNHQALGDFVLATAYQRADHVLDEVLGADVPVIPNHRLNAYLLSALETAGATYRLGVVHTTDNRDWELNQAATLARMRAARAVAVDMESATIAANGFRYRIPNATLLCVSDKPLHASPKLAGGARTFYEASKRRHLGLALDALDRVRRDHPGGLPTHEVRSPDEPLLGGPPDL